MSLTTRLPLILLVLGLAILYQTFLKTLLFVSYGIGREMQPISDFSAYSCHRIDDERLQGCEDMWLSESARVLFLACSDPGRRKVWMPNIGKLDAAGRAMNDAVYALKVDEPLPGKRSFEMNALRLENFPDQAIHLVGLTGRDISTSTSPEALELLLVNARPSVDPETGELVDNTKVGANMTVELFRTDSRATTLTHQRTYHHEGIRTPNNVAFAYGAGGFFFTNDHGTAKTGWRFEVAMLTGNGDVSYCDGKDGGCESLVTGLNFPNGLIMGMDGLLYVPSAFSGGIRVYKPDQHNMNLTQVDYIDIPYPLDNLSQDRNGDIWAAAIPKGGQMMALFEDPFGQMAAPTTLFRIRKRSRRGEWEITKVLEDRDAEILPGATTVVHDAKTRRIFVSSVASPFVAVCEPQR